MVKSALENGSKLLFQTQNTIISAASVLAVTYALGAVLGLVRSRLLAHYFGASDQLGIFYTADRIPGFIYSLLVVGTLSTVFIPVFAHMLKENALSAWRTASSIIMASLGIFLVAGFLGFIFSPQIITAISVGRFTGDQVQLGSNLMRIMLFAQLILILSSFFTSILQSFKYFLIPALAPVFYNVGMIVGIVLFVPALGIYAVAVGGIIGAFMHLLIQIPVMIKVKPNFTFAPDFADKGLREILMLVPPRILSTAVAQVFAIVNTSLAILVSTSSVVVYKFADQLQTFPVYLFGASIALAALPTLSGESGTNDKEQFRKTFLTSFHQMMFFVLPASILLLVLKLPAVRLVYGATNFPWDATLQTSYTLAFFSISIFAQAAILLLSRAFYALRNTVIPVVASVTGLLFEIVIAIVFIKVLGLGVWSIALAFSLGTVLDMCLLLFFLYRRIDGFTFDNLFRPFLKIGVATLLMGLSLYIPMKLLDAYVLDTTRTIYLLVLVFVVSVFGLVSYLLFTKMLRVKEIELLYKLVRKLNITMPAQAASPELNN
ncbi:MAG: Integral membrane protein MviN [candidate division WWE3 bacterium GW2011_GWA1_46_21]|uniref:Probable lipid II flippase MurJ n=3 Tax=Katanobacteria TaxID=422282 RepID=A0A0G1RPT3_UNCKA|nr:MAG: Integral membrane protein MviN [candidate division WWE3 bacterium GW2011_GWA1_46_21]KKU48617.1 MAG: Integral membrane protein MviN [candidate division WWE3 bacterium GW2011_GWA2_46_9]KKU51427.1 MAG: Integral membrane protein MviN [candidate division WWE3 bacterium GW2011_GWC1_47_10]